MPLKPGITPKQAQLQGTTGINAGMPVISSADFFVPTVPAGTMGVPAGDNVETVFGATGRDTFRAPFQERFDVTSTQYSTSNGVPTVCALSSSFGYIQSTLGSPRTVQFALHLVF
jgi:hypothetical protein